MNIIANSFTLACENFYPWFCDNTNEIDDIAEDAHKFSIEYIIKRLEICDKAIYSRLTENKAIRLVSLRERTILTLQGPITYRRRYYFDENNRQYFYPLDMILNLPKYERKTNKLKIRILEKASSLTYEQVGKSLSDYFDLSKSTIYRTIKETSIEKIECEIKHHNNRKIHVQIDEKYLSIKGKKHKSRLYTCTIFKGIASINKRSKLQNVSYISAKSVPKLAKRINKVLLEKYKVTLDVEVWLSGDYAAYIQTFPERITVCKAEYVPDKFHTMRALRTLLGTTPTVDDLNNKIFLTRVLEIEKNIDCYQKNKYQCQQVITYIKNHKDPFINYLNPLYDGCSQECTNSHIYSVRFGKYANRFNYETIEKLSLIKEAIASGGKIILRDIKKHRTYQEFDYKTKNPFVETPKFDIDLNRYEGQTRKMLAKIVYGVAKCL